MRIPDKPNMWPHLYRADKSNFLEFWVKMAKMTSKGHVNYIYFQYQRRVYPRMHVLRKFGDCSSNLCDRVDKVKFTDGRTDGRMDGQPDRRRQRQCPFGLKGQGIKIGAFALLVWTNWWSNTRVVGDLRNHTPWGSCDITLIGLIYRQTANISRTSVGNEIVEHSDVVGASPFILDLTAGFNGSRKDNCKTRRDTFKLWELVVLY